MVKRWLIPPSMTNQDLNPGIFHLEFFLKIQHVYGQKMIDPPPGSHQYDKPDDLTN